MTCLSEEDQLGWWRLKSPVMMVGMFGRERVERRGATVLLAGLYRLITSIEYGPDENWSAMIKGCVMISARWVTFHPL